MRDPSIYEGLLDKQLAGQTCIGRIVSVDPQLRRCNVKTLGLKGHTDDLDIRNVQILTISSNANGDENTALPRVGAYGIIVFVNSMPFILGYYTPVPPTGSFDRKDDVPLLPGDQILKTVAGNRLILRSGGSVEIESTKLCRVYLLPSHNLLNMVCQNLEMETDGGFWRWVREDETDDTLYQLLAHDNLTPQNAVQLELGKAVSGASLDLFAGPVDDDNIISENLFRFNVENTGETNLNVGPDLLNLNIQPTGALLLNITDAAGEEDAPTNFELAVEPTGDTTLNIGPGTFVLNVQPTGETDLNIGPDALTLNIQPTGETTTTIGDGGAYNYSVQPSGDTTLDVGPGAVTFKATADGSATLKISKVGIGDGSTEIFQTLVDSITAIGQVKVLTPLGPAAPIMASPEWSQVTQLLSKISALLTSVS